MRLLLPLVAAYMLMHTAYAQTPLQQDYQPPLTPQAEFYRQQISDQVLKQLGKIDWSQAHRTTNGTTVLYTIPVVVHVLHNYGPEAINDSLIPQMINGLNSYFLQTIPDTAFIIDKFKPVEASTQIAFKLATIDPNGNPTKGIDHIYTYLTYMNASFINQSKVNQWPQSKYLNIWVANTISSGIVAATYWTPFNAAYQPYYDGMTINFSFIGSAVQGMVHTFARYLNLSYPCGGYSCVDNDMIADTPPCDGNITVTCSNIYDTTCDTPNLQNIMQFPYSPCNFMFTYGQGQYMQYILQIDIGNRDSLVTPYNYTSTGMNQPTPDLPPVADFSVKGTSSPTAMVPPQQFFCTGQQVYFKNFSWNDTITAAAWTFSNNAQMTTSTALNTVTNSFLDPGWVKVSLSVTGNNTGTTTLTRDHALYIADSIPVNAAGYVQEFPERGGLSGWPVFNYYNNTFLWGMGTVGYFDHSCLEYYNYDTRTSPQNMTGTPEGDVDDIYTPAFDLSGFGDSCHLNFMSAGATRAARTKFMTDSLEIDYSVNQAYSWVKLAVIKGAALANAGTASEPFTPASMSDWVPRAITLPQAARTSYTLFRFRYYPGADSTGVSSGNNFYIDHVNFGVFPESTAIIDGMAEGVMLTPNPSNGETIVVVKDNTVIQQVSVTVCDIAGRVVYHIAENGGSNTLQMRIPRSVFGSNGLYFVKVVTDKFERTEKLVIY